MPERKDGINKKEEEIVSLAKDGELKIALKELITLGKDVINKENIHASVSDSMIITTPSHGDPN